jgi:hypothetical protein
MERIVARDQNRVQETSEEKLSCLSFSLARNSRQLQASRRRRGRRSVALATETEARKTCDEQHGTRKTAKSKGTKNTRREKNKTKRARKIPRPQKKETK